MTHPKGSFFLFLRSSDPLLSAIVSTTESSIYNLTNLNHEQRFQM